MLFVALVVLGIVFSFVQTQARNAGRASILDLGVRTLCSPIAVVTAKVSDATQGFFAGAFHGKSLQDDNERLKRQINLLSLYTESISRLEREVDSVRKLNELGPTYKREKVIADLIGYFPNEQRITIAAGRNHGIEPKMPVVSADGLIAIVQTVGPKECQALLLTSSTVKIGALAISHNPPPAGLISGENSTTLVLSFQDPQAPVVSGDLITTSGFSDRIPRGIAIGRVLSVEPLPEIGATRVRVFPSASIGTMREVVILK